MFVCMLTMHDMCLLVGDPATSANSNTSILVIGKQIIKFSGKTNWIQMHHGNVKHQLVLLGLMIGLTLV